MNGINDLKSGQSVDAYVLELKKQAAKCAFHTEEHDKLIRDRLVWGIRDKQLQEELLRDADLTLVKAINHCKIWETSKREAANIKADSPSSNSIVSVDRLNAFPDNRNRSTSTAVSRDGTRYSSEFTQRQECENCDYK